MFAYECELVLGGHPVIRGLNAKYCWLLTQDRFHCTQRFYVKYLPIDLTNFGTYIGSYDTTVLVVGVKQEKIILLHIITGALDFRSRTQSLFGFILRLVH